MSIGAKIKIILQSPVCIAKKKGVGNVIETLDYIPGTAIRGALSMLYLKQYGKHDSRINQWQIPDNDKREELNRLFNSADMSFGNCYPFYDGNPTQVIPLTAASCKLYSGFSETGGEEKTHGVIDLLIHLAKYEMKGELNILEAVDKCATCGAVMDRFNGYYTKTGETTFRSLYPSKRLIARTAVEDFSERALERSLYTIEVLNERQLFVGELVAEEPALFDNLNNLVNSNPVLRIGSARSRGLGEVQIEFIQVQKDYNPAKVRLEKFNKALDIGQDLFLFSITLYSDLILQDEVLRYKSTVEIKDLEDSIQSSGMDTEELDKFVLLRSWHTIHELNALRASFLDRINRIYKFFL